MESNKSGLVKFKQKAIKILMPESPPIFIVGCGHSGTSLLLSILGSHSRIYPVPIESKLGYKSIKKYFYLWKFKKATLASNKSRWVEKTPRHIYKIEELLELDPGVKILIIMRDGRDVACSYKERFGDIKLGINAWVDSIQAGEKLQHHLRVKLLKYEDLITDFENAVKEILDFLDEKFEPEVLRFYEQPKYFYSEFIEKPKFFSGNNHDQYRNWQINQPLFDGRGKWHSISKEEKILIKKIANDALLKTGYVKNKDW